jgi:hypothetical protein
LHDITPESAGHSADRQANFAKRRIYHFDGITWLNCRFFMVVLIAEIQPKQMNLVVAGYLFAFIVIDQAAITYLVW